MVKLKILRCEEDSGLIWWAITMVVIKERQEDQEQKKII